MGCFLSCFHSDRDWRGDLLDPLVVENHYLGDAFLDDGKKNDASGSLQQDAGIGGALNKELLQEDPLVVENHYLGDAFLDDGKKNDASGSLQQDAGIGGALNKELLQEANYLKSCGTISQTPPEILKVLDPGCEEDTIENEGILNNAAVMSENMLFEGNSSQVHFRFNSEKHDILGHQERITEDTNENDTSTNIQIVPEAMASIRNSSELLNYDEHDILRLEVDNVMKSKHLLDAESKYISSLQDKSPGQEIADQMIVSCDSPSATPLVLRGDSETPGTTYTALTSRAGKRESASRQFIYPVLRTIENKMQWMEVKDDSPVLSGNPPKRRYLSPDSSESPQKTSPCCVATTTELPKSASSLVHDKCVLQNEVISPEEYNNQNGNQHGDSEYEKNDVSSLSYWLKPSRDSEENIGKGTLYEKSISDVPLFATFDLKWDDNNPTPVLPKVWDGNGIPNTTNKYKEDKVVSWHATHFEERLMKVLSSEKPHSERKISGKLIQLEENVE